MKALLFNKQCLFALFVCAGICASAQTIGTFNSVLPTAQTQNLVLPSTHTFQRIIKTGDNLLSAGTLGSSLDFTGYVPISGSSTNGYLSISSETTPSACAVVGINFDNATNTWLVNSGGNIIFPLADLGSVSRFCSGTVTPNGTVIISEEDVSGADNNSDGYTDHGWLIEINPVTRTVVNQDLSGGVDKLWAIGRSNHENAVIKSDNSVLYTGADDATVGYLYKFVPAVAGNFSAGTLYVLQTTIGLGNGTWRILANATQADKNNTRSLSTIAGAYNFNGIEDVEIGPDGKIYFAAKAEGKVYRFIDNGTAGTATDVTGLEVFVGGSSKTYDVDGAGPFAAEAWGAGNDNLAFDGDGNLWVLQDGDRNHIWVVAPTHTQAVPQVRLFATTPAGSEPTGITFSPDYDYIFLSMQHPSVSNSISQKDATNTDITFNTHTTLVIARKENLGPTVVLPVKFLDFTVKQQNDLVQLNWTVAAPYHHAHFDIERSANGIQFETIYTERKAPSISAATLYSYTDKNPLAPKMYYRIKQVDAQGYAQYSETRMIHIDRNKSPFKVYPLPAAGILNMEYYASKKAVVTVKVFASNGQQVLEQQHQVFIGQNKWQMQTAKLLPASYFLLIQNGDGASYNIHFLKQ